MAESQDQLGEQSPNLQGPASNPQEKSDDQDPASNCLERHESPRQHSKGPGHKSRAPTLYAIVAIKLGKGLLLMMLALGVYSLSDNNLPQQFRELLQFFHLDPEKRFFTELAIKLSKITPGNIIWVARGTVLYSLFSLVEGVGLVFRGKWAGWMAIGESLFFIPIEVYELMRHFSVPVFIIMGINIWIVWYLVQNRRRLFHHGSAGAAQA